MFEATQQFFAELGQRGYEPLIGKYSGRVRFDLVDDGGTDQWLLTIDKGNLTVAHHGGTRTCTIRAHATLFDRLVRGEENAMAAVLRGAMVCTGDVDLLLAIQRIFPGPHTSREVATHGQPT